MELSKKSSFRISPTQVLVLGFLAVILVGAALLCLPAASVSGSSIGFLNALFTSTSAVCVTGLTVIDVGTTLSLFGQIVLLLLIQVGGLGFMTMATFVFLVVGKRITLRERMVIQESLNERGLQGVVKMVRTVFLMTLIIEGLGAILLSTRFIPLYGFKKGIYFGIFHSISAFCNAGFDLIGHSQNLTPFVGDITINLTIMALIILGGLGFAVITDVIHKRSWKKLMLHSKMVIMMTIFLLVAGFAFFLFAEWGNPLTLGDPELNTGERIMAGMFQSVTPRTAGFNTISQAGLTDASKLVTMLLMFIGASPASTGGGVKTTTVAVMLMMGWAAVRGREDINFAGKRIAMPVLLRALAIIMVSIVLVCSGAIVISLVERGSGGQALFNFEDVMYEVFSAFGTVGLSTGITPALSSASRILLILIMFAGRVGPLTLTLAFARRMSRNNNNIRYPEDRVMVG